LEIVFNSPKIFQSSTPEFTLPYRPFVVIKLSFKYFYFWVFSNFRFDFSFSAVHSALVIYISFFHYPSPPPLKLNINMSYKSDFCSSAICRKNSIRCHLSLRASYFSLIFGAIFHVFCFLLRFWAGKAAGKLCSIIFSKNNVLIFHILFLAENALFISPCLQAVKAWFTIHRVFAKQNRHWNWRHVVSDRRTALGNKMRN
jgi:hypothetical protein